MDGATGDTTDTPSAVARQLLERVRREQPTESREHALAALDEASLADLRTDRRSALAFWLNVYNATAQLLLERRPALYESRWRFFRTTAATVAGIDVSLDDIEHGIMRDKQSKYGLGYLPRLARCRFGPAYRLDVDPRIHFVVRRRDGRPDTRRRHRAVSRPARTVRRGTRPRSGPAGVSLVRRRLRRPVGGAGVSARLRPDSARGESVAQLRRVRLDARPPAVRYERVRPVLKLVPAVVVRLGGLLAGHLGERHPREILVVGAVVLRAQMEVDVAGLDLSLEQAVNRTPEQFGWSSVISNERDRAA